MYGSRAKQPGSIRRPRGSRTLWTAHQPERIARSPAINAGDRIPGQHRLAIVEFEARPQAECPGEAVARDFLGLDHLALDLEFGIHAVERVLHQQAGVASDIDGGPDRIEVGEVRVRHESDCPGRGALRYCRSG
jgi:hypothetical protein